MTNIQLRRRFQFNVESMDVLPVFDFNTAKNNIVFTLTYYFVVFFSYMEIIKLSID